MLLSDITKKFCLKISSDITINNLKLLFQDKTDALVYVKDESFFAEAIKDPTVKAIIAPSGYTCENRTDCEVIAIDNPEELFFKIHEHLVFKTDFYYKKVKTSISPSAKISTLAKIAPYDVVIKDNAIIDDFVKIEPNTYIGANCIINSGSVIGGDGIHISSSGTLTPHGGHVYISDGTVIGANTVIDKGLFKDTTFIGKNTIIGSLVKIAHNVYVGDKTIVAANAQLAGSSTVLNNVFIGPSASVGGRITVNDNAHVSIGTVVVKNIPDGQRVIGRNIGHIPVTGL